MKTKLNQLSILSLILSISLSCTQKQDQISGPIFIDLDELPARQIDISSYLNDIRVIPLETTPENMLGTFSLLDQDDSNIFYLSREDQAISHFSSKGKYINKFCHKGKGPGEYNRIKNMHLVPGSESILISDDRQKKMIQYNFAGNFINEFTLPNSTGHFVVLNNNLIALYLSKMSGFTSVDTKHDLIFMDLGGNIVAKQFPHNTRLHFAFGAPFTRPDPDGTFYYSMQFDFNLYSLKDTSRPQIAFSLDYGNHAASIDDLSGPGIEDLGALNKQGKKSYMDHPINTKKDLALINYKDRKTSMMLINKKTQQLRLFGTDSLRNLGYLHSFPIHIPRDSYKENFIVIHDAVDLYTIIQSLSSEQKNKLNKRIKGFDQILNIKEDDNPVLVYYNFKSF
ncbi:MAG: 6-bladed beta-propeller [Bacteroidales bacterium]|nr:6-bladed beta-propeller [Bacteroidales bacterium]